MAQTIPSRKVLTWCWRGVIAAGYAVAILTSLAGALYALYVAITGLFIFREFFPLAALVPATLNLCYLAFVLLVATGSLGRARVFSAYFALPILVLLPLAVVSNWWFYGLLGGV